MKRIYERDTFELSEYQYMVIQKKSGVQIALYIEFLFYSVFV